MLISSSADKTARIWQAAEGGSGFTCSSVLKEHAGEVVGVTLHPSRKYFVTGSADASWGFWDLASATCLRQVSDEAAREAYTTIQFHPDGLILGTGGDLLQGGGRARTSHILPPNYCDPRRSPALSYFLAGTEKSVIKIWEVKQQKNVAVFTEHTRPIRCLAFSENG